MTRFAIAHCVVVILGSSVSFAGEPLHRRIDAIISASFKGEPAPQSDDAEFFRRVNLDLAGRIPTAEETRRFLADKSADKRLATIDRLLVSAGYADRLANQFHVMLMERRGDNDDWHKFLSNCFAENRPWDQIVRDILHPQADNETNRGAAYFITRRLEKVGQQQTDYPGLTRDVGRMFLGVDLQCAECHDHLFIDDYKQRDFQGLFAVYKNVSIRKDKFPAINEKVVPGKLEFVSVFAEGKKSTGPRIPFGQEFEIPAPPTIDPKAPKKKRDPNAPPYFSALGAIADALPSTENELFKRNIANRLWFCMMGRGLVEPLDEFHSGNPATHPQLLQLLADEFAARKFDIKWMIRELARTETWQRGSRFSGDKLPSRTSYQLGNQRRLTAEQLFWSTLQATGNLGRLAPKKGSEPSDEFKELKASFVKAFATEPKEETTEYTPGVKQALFLSNDSKLLSLLEPQQGNLFEKLSGLPDAKAVDQLFLSIYTRMPDDAERTATNEFLQKNKDKRTRALGQLAWAMLSSIEFSINH
jgi:hypothetical protein